MWAGQIILTSLHPLKARTNKLNMDTPCCIDQSLLLWTLETGSFHGNMELASERQVSAPQKTAPVMSGADAISTIMAFKPDLCTPLHLHQP